MRTRFSAFSVLALLVLVGCGGGAPHLSGRASGRAIFTVVWPASSSRLIPVTSNSIVVQVKSGTLLVTSQTLAKPKTGNTANAIFDPLPAGSLTATATAYPNADGTGVAQAQASTPLTITVGQTTNFTLTMASTIDHLDLTSATPNVAMAKRIQLTATPKDAFGNIVLTSPSALQWSSATPATAVVDSSGIVAGLAVGSAQITATDTESGKTGTTTVTVQAGAGLVSWWRGEGNTKDSADGNDGLAFGNLTYGPGVVGQAFVFNGVDTAIAVPDVANLQITKSLSIDVRVKVEGLPPSNVSPSNGMIVFRGDSRAGFDSYWLGMNPDGTIEFAVGTDTPVFAFLSVPMPLFKWVHVTATLDDATGLMLLYFDGQIVAQTITAVRPLGPLDPASHPGIGIGNHAGFPNSNFNYPFNGSIDEVAIYNTAITPGL